MHRFLAIVLALAAVALTATVASGAPDRTQAFDAAGEFKWEGPEVNGASPLFDGTACENPAPAGPYCDQTVIELKTAGTLKITIDGWNENSDLDLFLRKSDADGTYGEEVVAPPLGSGVGPETLTVKNLAPGFYLIAVNYFQAVQATYSGVAVFTPAGAAAPAPAATATPAPVPGGSTPPPASSGGGDSGALPTSGTLSASLKVASAKTRKPTVSVGCTVVCKVSLRLVVKGKVLGKATATVDRKQPAPIVIKLSAKGKKALKKARKARATIKATVTDSSGGQKKALLAKATLKR